MEKSKKGKNLTRMIEKYAEEKKENFEAIKEGMKLYEDYLKQTSGESDRGKIIVTEGYNVYSYKY